MAVLSVSVQGGAWGNTAYVGDAGSQGLFTANIAYDGALSYHRCDVVVTLTKSLFGVPDPSFVPVTLLTQTGVVDSIPFRVPKEMAAEPVLFDASTCIVTVSAQGKNIFGNDSGSKRTGTGSAQVPSTGDFLPVVSGVIAEIDNGDISSLISIGLQNRSRIQAFLTSATAGYGATISRITAEVIADGTFFLASTTIPFTSGAVSVSNLSVLIDKTYNRTNLALRISVVNGRDLTGSSQTLLTLHPYNPPRLVSFNAFRCNVDLSANNLGEYFAFTADIAVDTLGGINSLQQLEYAWGGDGIPFSAWFSFPSGTQIGPIGDGEIVYTKNYEIQIRISDLISEILAGGSLPRKKTTRSYLAGGEGMALGKDATVPNKLDVAWDIRSDGDIIVGNTLQLPGGYSIEYSPYPPPSTGSSLRILYNGTPIFDITSTGWLSTRGNITPNGIT